MLGVEDKVPVPVIKLNVGKVRIDSDSESKYDEEEVEFAIPNSEQVVFPEETKIILPERIQGFYGTNNYEWNHYKLPVGEVYEFPKVNKHMKLFLDTLYMPTKDNISINHFLPLSQNYIGKFEYPQKMVDDPLAGEDDSGKTEQSKDCLYLNLLYALRHAATGEYSHTADFSCLNEMMLEELKGIWLCKCMFGWQVTHYKQYFNFSWVFSQGVWNSKKILFPEPRQPGKTSMEVWLNFVCLKSVQQHVYCTCLEQRQKEGGIYSCLYLHWIDCGTSLKDTHREKVP